MCAPQKFPQFIHVAQSSATGCSIYNTASAIGFRFTNLPAKVFNSDITQAKCVDDDEFRFNDASTHVGHLRQNGEHGSVMQRL